MTPERQDYAKRLISGVRKQIAQHMKKKHSEILKDHPEAISSQWLDAELLCLVVEKDVLGIDIEIKNTAKTRPN